MPYLTLKTEGQNHVESRPKSNQVVYWSGPSIMPKVKQARKVVRKLLREQSLRPAAAYEPVQKHIVTIGTSRCPKNPNGIHKNGA